jgi:hypothetical protein
MISATQTQPGPSRLNRAGALLVVAMPLFALINLIPFAHLGSLAIRPTDLLFVLAGLALGLDMLFNLRAPKGVIRYCCIIVFLLAITGLGDLVFPNSVDWPRYLRFIETMLWGALALAFIRQEKQLRRYGNMVLLCAVVVGGSSVYFFVTNPELQRIAGYMALDPEVDGLLNEWGGFYVLAMAILLSRVYSGGWSLVRFAILGLIGVGLLLLQSRSAFLAMGLIIFVFMVLWIRKIKRRESRWHSFVSVMCLLGLIAGIFLGSEMLPVNRIKESFNPKSFEAGSTQERYVGWRKSKELWGASAPRFLFGYGNKKFVGLLRGPTSESFYFDHGVGEGFISLMLIMALLVTPVLTLRHEGIKSQRYVLVMLITLNALLVSVTGNVLVDPIFGGVTFGMLYGNLSAGGQSGPMQSE